MHVTLCACVYGVIFLSFFAAKYREYHQLYESGKFVSAGKLLVTLLLSNTVPTRYGGVRTFMYVVQGSCM